MSNPPQSHRFPRPTFSPSISSFVLNSWLRKQWVDSSTHLLECILPLVTVASVNDPNRGLRNRPVEVDPYRGLEYANLDQLFNPIARQRKRPVEVDPYRDLEYANLDQLFNPIARQRKRPVEVDPYRALEYANLDQLFNPSSRMRKSAKYHPVPAFHLDQLFDPRSALHRLDPLEIPYRGIDQLFEEVPPQLEDERDVWEQYYDPRGNNDPYRAYRAQFIEPGDYAISYKLNYTYSYKNNAGVVGEYPVDVLQAQHRTVTVEEGPKTLADLLEEMVGDYQMNNHLYRYDFEIKSVTDVDIRLLYQRELGNIRLRGAKLHYKFLSEIKNINKSMGQCVFDYITYEINRDKRSVTNPHGKQCIRSWTKENLVKYFGASSLKDGVTTNQIMQWAKDQEYVSCYALDPFLQTFMQHIAHGGTTLHVLCFIVNNEHCYPITNVDYKKQIISKGRIDLDDFKFDVTFGDGDYSYVGYNTMHMTNEELSSDNLLVASEKKKIRDEVSLGTYGDKTVVLFETDNLSEIIANMSMKTGYLAYNMRFSGNCVTYFEHPTTQRIYIAAVDHNDRTMVCNVLYEKFKCMEFCFVNQSFNQIANTYFKYTSGILPPSECSTEVSDIFQRYRITPYITQFEVEYPLQLLKGLDITRCYNGIVKNNRINYNNFRPFDQPEKFVSGDYRANKQLPYGEYYINRCFFLGGGTIKAPNGWYPLVLVDYCLKRRYITRGDITTVIKASCNLPHDTFKNFVEGINTIFDGSHLAKNLINCFIGGLNQQYVTSTKGCVTESYEIAMGTMLSEQAKGLTPRLHTINDLFFVRSEHKERKNSNHVPINRHILASAYIELDRLHAAVCDENTIVVAYNTDSIKVLNPKTTLWNDLEAQELEAEKLRVLNEKLILNNQELVEDPDLIIEIEKQKRKVRKLLPGGIRIEHKLNVKGKMFGDLADNDPYEYLEPQWTKIIENTRNYKGILNTVRDSSCLVTGIGGCGKTYLIIQAWLEKAQREGRVDGQPIVDDGENVAVAFTNKVCENLKLRGIPTNRVSTLHSFFPESASFKDHFKKVSAYKRFFVDEYSMVPSKFLALLAQIKNTQQEKKKTKPDTVLTQFKLFGDMDQCTSVEERIYDYNNSSLVKGLCDSKFIQLKYKDKRYDGPYHEVIKEFMQTKKLPETLRTQCNGHIPCYINLTLGNSQRRQINAECLARFLAEFTPEVKVINNITWAIGMPLIAKENVRGALNDAKRAWSSNIMGTQLYQIFNSQSFTIERFTATSVVVLRTEEPNDEGAIPLRWFNEIMDPAFAITINKFQGSEIKDHFNIHVTDRMSFNHVYTALARGVSLDKVHINYTDRIFEKAMPTKGSTLVKAMAAPMIEGIVYKITDLLKSFVYIGYTTTTLEQRLQEHREKPTNPAMSRVINQPDITISALESIRCLDVSSLLKLEDFYITQHVNEQTTADGPPVLNIKRPKVKVPMKVTIVHEPPPVNTKFQVRNDEVKKILRVSGTVLLDGKKKKIDKEWKYNERGYEVVRPLADAFSAEMINKHIR